LNMKLVDRYTQEVKKDLSALEKKSLVELYGKSSTEHAILSQELLKGSRVNGQYFLCDCITSQPASPMLTTRQVRPDVYALVNLPGRMDHADTCPFHYQHAQHGGGGGDSAKLPPKKIVYSEDGRFHVDKDQLATLYRTIITNTQLNRITSNNAADAETYRTRLIDGARLTPRIAKQGIGKKIRFGLDHYSDVTKALRQGEDDWQILISVIDGTDGINIYSGEYDKKPYKIPAGEIVSWPKVTFGPMVATTIIVSKGGHTFSLATAIDSVYQTRLPIVVSCQEDRDILSELTGTRPLLEWIDEKQPGSVSFVDMHCLPVISPISGVTTTPRMTVGKQQVRLLIADPTKQYREAYDEQGIILWHRSFSHIPAKAKTETNQFKSKIAAILLKKGV
jgi:hypothetical protein